MEKLYTPVSWLGTKTRMRPIIVPILNRVKYSLYVEPFGGACGLLFGKRPTAEVYNDINRNLVNLMTALRDPKRAETLEYLCAVSPTSRDMFYTLRDIATAYANGDDIAPYKESACLTAYDDETAAAFAFFYVMNNCFRAHAGDNPTFGGGTVDNSGKDPTNAMRTQRQYYLRRTAIRRFCERLQYVLIENLDFRDCVKRYNVDSTLFYFDPPYECATSRRYDDTPKAKDIVDCIFTIKGYWALSCYDVPEYERLLEMGEKRQFYNFSCLALNADKKNCARTETFYTNIPLPKDTLF